ncbi:MAG: sporulation initiation factor Spo0A C-terminal domain-containing protein [Eubacteriales bacterium]|nr:sporulation initiation factor Spo0A C-terminal domain-containing protein [Eubacteriales bacterium]
MNNSVLQTLAKQHHVTVDEIRAEMEFAIEEGYKKQTATWQKLFGDRKPTIEEFLDAMVQQIKKTY